MLTMTTSSLPSDLNVPAAPEQIRDVRNTTEVALEKGKFSKPELHAIHSHGDLYIPAYQEFAHAFALRMMTPAFDLAGALALLGQTSLVTHEQNSTTFGQPSPKGQIVACPNMAQIQECAAQNKAGTHKWVLAYGSTQSFRSQHSTLGTDKTHKPNYYPGVDWFLKPNYKEVGDSKPEAGYYLLDMTPRWNLTNWQQQEENIAALGEDYERADERIFSQVVLAHQEATGQRLFNDKWHWGRILVSDGCRVCVRLSSDGLDVNDGPPSYGGGDDLCVCVARKSRDRALIA